MFKKWKFRGGGGDLREIPSVVGVWIFSGTTQLHKFQMYPLYCFLLFLTLLQIQYILCRSEINLLTLHLHEVLLFFLQINSWHSVVLIIKVELKMVSSPTFDGSKMYFYIILYYFLVTNMPSMPCIAVAYLNFGMVHTAYMYCGHVNVKYVKAETSILRYGVL